MPEHYQIRIDGHLDREWSAWFDGLTFTHDPDGCTTLVGPVADQAALYGLLGKARDLGLRLILVARVAPDEGRREEPMSALRPTHRIAVSDGELSAYVAGSGPALVFLHGNAGRWQHWGPPLQALSRQFCCIAFRADTRGRITHLFQGNLAIVGFQRLAWYEAPALHYAILAGGGVLFLATLFGASIGWLRRRGSGSPATRLPVVARGLAWWVSALYLLFLVLFAVSMGDLTRFPTPQTLVALSLALVAALGSCASVVCATLIWMQRPWGIIRRVGYSLFALGALAFAWCLSYWNLLGFWR